METHSSTLAWKTPWREEPGRLPSWGRKESDMTEQLYILVTTENRDLENTIPQYSSSLI